MEYKYYRELKHNYLVFEDKSTEGESAGIRVSAGGKALRERALGKSAGKSVSAREKGKALGKSAGKERWA